MTDHTALDDFIDSIDPTTLSQSDALTYALVAEVRGLRTDVTDERTGRRLSIRLTRVAGVVMVVVLAVSLVRWRLDDARYSRSTCAERIARSEQIEEAIVVAVDAGVDVVARFAEIPAADRVRISDDASKAAGDAVAEALPPPDC